MQRSRRRRGYREDEQRRKLLSAVHLVADLLNDLEAYYGLAVRASQDQAGQLNVCLLDDEDEVVPRTMRAIDHGMVAALVTGVGLIVEQSMIVGQHTGMEFFRHQLFHAGLDIFEEDEQTVKGRWGYKWLAGPNGRGFPDQQTVILAALQAVYSPSRSIVLKKQEPVSAA